ncbi:uncharacterized protein LOC124112582 [Haliotis rufescens]|uniref:uncharacterized protein LOC124112582 n=1 Tax=Haliotis rufescens TaxID=6454 RepID=UPI00201ECC66|nr:uncharacterized protein LOC124112582 [Haliotis rufescens]
MMLRPVGPRGRVLLPPGGSPAPRTPVRAICRPFAGRRDTGGSRNRLRTARAPPGDSHWRGSYADSVNLGWPVGEPETLDPGQLRLPQPVRPPFPSPVGARLQTYWENWEQVFDDPWVVNMIRYGYRLDLKADPPLTATPLEGFYSEADLPILADAIGRLVEKRAVRELALPEITPGFYSRIFLVPKKDSAELRMIHNLKSFNEFYLHKPPKFGMLTLADLKALIMAADWLASIDLKDAYLHVLIHSDHHRYLRFVFQGRRMGSTPIQPIVRSLAVHPVNQPPCGVPPQEGYQVLRVPGRLASGQSNDGHPVKPPRFRTSAL